jgi:hypothetical protein
MSKQIHVAFVTFGISLLIGPNEVTDLFTILTL